jgi:hypothetical protein
MAAATSTSLIKRNKKPRSSFEERGFLFAEDQKIAASLHSTAPTGEPAPQASVLVAAETVGDFGSRERLEDILESEEEHIDWLETQLGLIDKVGLENYLQSQMGEE